MFGGCSHPYKQEILTFEPIAWCHVFCFDFVKRLWYIFDNILPAPCTRLTYKSVCVPYNDIMALSNTNSNNYNTNNNKENNNIEKRNTPTTGARKPSRTGIHTTTDANKHTRMGTKWRTNVTRVGNA